MSNNFEIIKFVDNDFELDVRADKANETVWLSQWQISLLFDKSRATITEHINNIFKENELDEFTCVGISDISGNHRPAKLYNLDVVISVGYRVKSQRGIIFRRWANRILKDYLVQGYAINQKRMIALNKTIEIQNKMLASTLNIEEETLCNVIDEYTKALDLLDDYDHQQLHKPTGRKTIYRLSYEHCRNIINSMKFNETSNIFGVEKETGKLDGILAAVYQNVFGREVYPSTEEKASHLLYFLVKDHPFVDGCKRIAATLFLEFLNKNNVLIKNGKLSISKDALVAVTLLCAESKPDEMDIIINLIMNILLINC